MPDSTDSTGSIASFTSLSDSGAAPAVAGSEIKTDRTCKASDCNASLDGTNAKRRYCSHACQERSARKRRPKVASSRPRDAAKLARQRQLSIQRARVETHPAIAALPTRTIVRGGREWRVITIPEGFTPPEKSGRERSRDALRTHFRPKSEDRESVPRWD